MRKQIPQLHCRLPMQHNYREMQGNCRDTRKKKKFKNAVRSQQPQTQQGGIFENNKNKKMVSIFLKSRR